MDCLSSSSEQLSPQAKESVEWILRTVEESTATYSESIKDKGYISFKKQTEDCKGVILLRAQMEFEGIPADELFVMLEDFNVRQKWDVLICEMEVIEKIDQFSDIVYYNIPSPGFMVQRREFLNTRTLLKDSFGYEYIETSRYVEHPAKPKNSKFVRAKLLNSGYVIKSKNEHSSTATLIVQVDIGGLVPQWLVNLKADDGPYTLWKTVRSNYHKLSSAGLLKKPLRSEAPDLRAGL